MKACHSLAAALGKPRSMTANCSGAAVQGGSGQAQWLQILSGVLMELGGLIHWTDWLHH